MSHLFSATAFVTCVASRRLQDEQLAVVVSVCVIIERFGKKLFLLARRKPRNGRHGLFLVLKVNNIIYRVK